MGYRMIRVHDVWKFGGRRRGLFASYGNTWLQLKIEAIGWPGNCNTPVEREEHIANYERTEGIRLHPTKNEKNPGLRYLARLMLHSLWRKFGQRGNLLQIKAFYDPNPFRLFLDTDQHAVHHRSQSGDKDINPNINIFIAAFTTFWVRLHLYEALKELGKLVLY